MLHRLSTALSVAVCAALVFAASAPVRAQEPSRGVVVSGDALYEVGDTEGVWTVTGVESHVEFRRYAFEDADGERYGVEVTVAGGGQAIVQPAPNRTAPSELLEAVRVRVAATGDELVDPVRSGIPGIAGRGVPTWARVTLNLLALLFAIATMMEWIRAAVVRLQGPDGVVDSVVAAGVALGVFLVAAYAVPTELLYHDPVRDLGLARDCAEGLFCGRGAQTSFGGIAQGALWVRWLGVLRTHGVTPDELSTVNALLHSVGAIAILLMARDRDVGRPGAIAIVVGWLAANIATGCVFAIWNPVLVPVGGAVFAAAAVRTMDRGDIADVIAGSVGLVVLAEGHIAALALLPVWLLAVATYSRRPGRAVTAAALCVAAVHWSMSPWTVQQNVDAALEGGLLVPFAAATAAAAALGAWLRRRAPTIPLALAATALVPVGALLLSAMLGKHYLTGRYAAPTFGLAAGLAAVLAARIRPGRWAWTAPVVALVLLVAVTRPYRLDPQTPGLLVSDAGAVVDRLADYGGYADLMWSLRAKDAQLLAEFAGVELALDHTVETPADGVFVVIGTGEHPETRGRATVLPLALGRHAVVGTFDPWVQRSPAEGCRTDTEPPACVRVERGLGDTGPSQGLYANRNGHILGGDDAYRGLLDTWILQVTPDANGRRSIAIMNAPSPHCRAFFTAVDGVDFEGTLPAERLVLLGGDTPGRLVVSVDQTPCGEFTSFPPSVLEIEPGDEWLERYVD